MGLVRSGGLVGLCYGSGRIGGLVGDGGLVGSSRSNRSLVGSGRSLAGCSRAATRRQQRQSQSASNTSGDMTSVRIVSGFGFTLFLVRPRNNKILYIIDPEST